MGRREYYVREIPRSNLEMLGFPRGNQSFSKNPCGNPEVYPINFVTFLPKKMFGSRLLVRVAMYSEI